MLLTWTVYRYWIHFLACRSLYNLLKMVLKVISEPQIPWPLLSLLWTLSLHVTLLTDTYSSFSFHESLPLGFLLSFPSKLWSNLLESYFSGAMSSTFFQLLAMANVQNFAWCFPTSFLFTCMASPYFHRRAPVCKLTTELCAFVSNGLSAVPT